MRVGHDVTNGVVDRQLVRLKYGLRGLIPDGALIRISTIGLPKDASFKLQDQFIRDLLAAVPLRNSSSSRAAYPSGLPFRGIGFGIQLRRGNLRMLALLSPVFYAATTSLGALVVISLMKPSWATPLDDSLLAYAVNVHRTPMQTGAGIWHLLGRGVFITAHMSWPWLVDEAKGCHRWTGVSYQHRQGRKF